MASTDIIGEVSEEEIFKKVSMWNVPALKKFLSKRDISVSGNKDMLISKVFSCCLLKIPIALTAQERLKKTSDEYILILNGQPDPFSLKDGWLNEKDGITKWPPIMLLDISEYLRQHETDIETASLRSRLIRDYKEQKAFSYFSSNWLFEVYLHQIKEGSNLVFLKAECRPSQRINQEPHQAWILCNISGEIISAYCTCFAGLGQSCNHVGAILLKIDYCWKYGFCNPACTSKECTWNTLGHKPSVVKAKKIKDMEWKKPSAEKEDNIKVINPQTRQMFMPKVRTGITFNDFVKGLVDICPDAVFLKERKEKPIEIGQSHETTNSTTQGSTDLPQMDDKCLPLSLPNIADKCQSVEDFLKSIPTYTKDMIQAIEKGTRKQSKCKEWFHQRKGCLTASVFHDIDTRVQTIKKNPDVDPTNLIKRIMGYISAPDHIKALKYGNRMEPLAKKKYEQTLRAEGHKDVLVQECGLFVYPSKPYIRATPDLLISDSCCGEGVVEIKCPWSSSHTAPCPETVSFLCYNENNKIHLKGNHKYMAQCVGPIAVTDRAYCDFFVYTMHGYVRHRIQMHDMKPRWLTLCDNLSFFYNHYIASELVHHVIEKQMIAKTHEAASGCNVAFVPDSTAVSASQPPAEPMIIQSASDTTAHVPASNTTVLPPVASMKSRRKQRGKSSKLAKPKSMPKCLCGKCCLEVKDVVDDETEFSILCSSSKCNKWFHWKCVGINMDSPEANDPDAVWFCEKCLLTAGST